MIVSTATRKFILLLSAGLSISAAACGDDAEVGGSGGSTLDEPDMPGSTSGEPGSTTGAMEASSTSSAGSTGSASEGDSMNSTGSTGSEGTTTTTTSMTSTTTTTTVGSSSGEVDGSSGVVAPICGDGVVDGQEQCDDSNLQGGDGCSAACLLESCGNGVVDVGEACDDAANQNQDDGCTDTCQLPACGDGYVQPGIGESCDQGEGNLETGECTPSCTLAVCGDGLVRAGVEACDDGNAVANDGCTNDCKLPSCGDGLLQVGEVCDTGIQDDGTSCAIDCKAKCLYLQPGPDLGKDTRAWSRPDKVNEKISNWVEFSALAWTWDGVPGVMRSFIQFDFSEIPKTAKVTSALLNLYGIGKHSSLSHSNASVLRRVVDPWQEGGVSWASKPQTTALNEVALPQSVNPDQDYSVSVLPLVKDAVLDPDHAHGFMLKLNDESYYASMQFASSDHPDPSKRPRLQVCYRVE